MYIMNKTEKGTIATWRHENGISVGFYKTGHYESYALMSFEYDEETKEFKLVLFDSAMKSHNVKIVHK